MCQVSELKVHKKCHTPDEKITLYISIGDKTIGVCDKCWAKIADKDWEVGNGPKLTIEEILSDKSRGLEGAVETEYKLKDKKLGEQTKEEEEFE
jgi:hypothetical protein